MSLESLVRSHVRGRTNQLRLVEKFRSEVEREKLRLRVDIFNESTGEQTVGISPVIVNTNSRCCTLDIHYAHPLRSCELGGRIITVVSEFDLCKDFMAQPRFLIFDSGGQELTELQSYIQQPEAEDIRVHKNAVIFRTAKQDPEFIKNSIKNCWKVKLCLVKKFSGFSMKSKNFDFQFEQHDISAGGEVNVCTFCHLPLDFPNGASTSLTSLPEPSCKPGPNKRRLINSSLEISAKKSLIEVQTDSLTFSSSTSRSKDVELSDPSVRRKYREIISTVRNPRATVSSHFAENPNFTRSSVIVVLLIILLCYLILCYCCDGSVANGIAITVMLLIVSGLLMKKIN